MRSPGPRTVLLLAVLYGALAAPALAAGVDLIGTWHVLVHYRDSATANPDVMRWDDRVWVFSREGSRLRWVEYPLVVFRDQSGRFEKVGTNRAARVLHAWEPNEGQLEQIRGGLQINPRGSESKTLSGSEREGWRSRAPIRAMGASYLTYSEVWSIEDPAARPVFRMEETLSGARAESLEGVTEYRTHEVEPEGRVLRGTYNRDDARIGTFRVMRAGDVGEVPERGPSHSERLRTMFAGQLGGADAEGLAALLATPQGEGRDAEEAREAIRPELKKQVEAYLREQGMDPRAYQPEVDRLTDRILEQWQRGKSAEEIQRMLREGTIDARP